MFREKYLRKGTSETTDVGNTNNLHFVVFYGSQKCLDGIRGNKTSNKEDWKFQSTNTVVRTVFWSKVVYHLHKSMAVLSHFAEYIKLLD
jgi:hypothetical protein